MLRGQVGVERAFKVKVADELWSLGYRTRTKGVLTAAVSTSVLAWLGLNVAVNAVGPVEVNPVVGVRHQRVHELIAHLRGERSHAFAPPTVSSSIGYLMRDASYRPWRVTADDVDAQAHDLVQQVAAVALPFARSLVSLEALADALTDYRFVDAQSRGYRLPTVLLLLGRPADALREVDAHLAAYGRARHAAAAQYRAFARAFRDHASRDTSAKHSR